MTVINQMQSEKLRIGQTIKIFNNRVADYGDSSRVMNEEPGEEIAEENINIPDLKKQESETKSPIMSPTNHLPTPQEYVKHFDPILGYFFLYLVHK